MVLDSLVRNYYETHGNFEGVKETVVGDALEVISTKSGASFNDVCYFLLGYSWQYGKSPSEVAEIRKGLYENGDVLANRILRDDTALLKRIGVSTGNVRSTLEKAFKVHPRSINKKSVKVPKNCEDILLLAETFYKLDVSNILQDGDSFTSFPIWLRANAHKYRRLLDLEIVKPCLLNFQYKEGVEPTIVGRTLFHSENLGDKDIKNINQQAINNVTLLHSYLKPWVKIPIEQLAFLSSREPKKYLELLDCCSVNGDSYADAVSQLGIQVVDLFKIYAYAGFLVLSIGERYAVQTDASDDWTFIDEFALVKLLNSGEVTSLTKDVDMLVAEIVNAVERGSIDRGNATYGIHSF